MSACKGGTRGSGVLSSAGDVLDMSVVGGVNGVCDMCMCLARGGVGGVGGERIGFGLYQSWRNRENVGCVCVLVAVVWVVLGEWLWSMRMPLPYGRLLHRRPALTNGKSCRMQH